MLPFRLPPGAHEGQSPANRQSDQLQRRSRSRHKQNWNSNLHRQLQLYGKILSWSFPGFDRLPMMRLKAIFECAEGERIRFNETLCEFNQNDQVRFWDEQLGDMLVCNYSTPQSVDPSELRISMFQAYLFTYSRGFKTTLLSSGSKAFARFTSDDRWAAPGLKCHVDTVPNDCPPLRPSILLDLNHTHDQITLVDSVAPLKGLSLRLSVPSRSLSFSVVPDPQMSLLLISFSLTHIQPIQPNPPFPAPAPAKPSRAAGRRRRSSPDSPATSSTWSARVASPTSTATAATDWRSTLNELTD